MLAGIAWVLLISLVAGGIAYIGDRVGHNVGRKRLTMFGLRPKYTSTVVAVATGMLIALSVTMVALIASQQVRTAFFRLGQINARINDLQAQALAMQHDIDTTRKGAFSLPIGYPIANIGLTTRPSQTDAVVMAQLSAFFDQTVRAANEQFARAPYDLKPYRHKSSEPEIQAALRQELKNVRATLPGDEPVLFLPLVAQNLFQGDVISFRLQPYPDTRVIAAGDVLASLDVQGGQNVNFLQLQQLIAAASIEARHRGMPSVFAANPQPANNPNDVLTELTRLRGKYRIVAKAGADLYPHSGGVLLTFSLVPR
ncbi:MAG TPA: DUF3084 domain-containing protein [Candidatus Limnocylindrales bacterium]|nr:DUF3084 domain-containing protein [Candidatus Limnocylindrales bacterium]